MKLSTQYIVLVVTLLCAAMAGAIGLNYYVLGKALEERQQIWAETLASSLSEGLARDILELRQLRLREVLVKIADESPEIEYAFVTGFEGKVMAHSFADGFPKVLLPSSHSSEMLLSHHNHELGGHSIVEVAFQIVPGMDAHLYLGISQEGNARVLRRLSGLFALLAAVIVVTGVLLSTWLGRRLSQPLQRLADDVTRYGATGTLSATTEVSTCIEAQQLQNSFLEMVSAREASNAALAQSNTRLAQVMRIINEGLWDWNIVTGTVTHNLSWCETLGLDENHLEHPLEGFSALIHPDDRTQVMAAIRESLDSTGRYYSEHRMLRSDGTVIWVQDRGDVIERSVTGEPLRMAGSVTDITSRKQAEEALRQLNEQLEQRVEQRTVALQAAKEEAERANAAKSEFLSRMSHELRTPLNAVIGFGQLLESDPDQPLTEMQLDNLHEILNAGHHLLTLVNEVLDLSQIEKGALQINLETVAISPLVEIAIAHLEPHASKRHITIIREITSCAAAQADPVRLKMVLLNLISNAIKFNRDGGSIKIDCTLTETQRQRISIQDSGRGIATASLPRLFRPFERPEPSQDSLPGIGVGLALSKRLVEAMNGTIGVESIEGSGSTFWVELPIATGNDMTEENYFPRRPRVLYIEDNPANLRLVQKIFTNRPQFELLEASSAEEGLEMISRHPPELILMDINLRGMDGYEALRQLRADSSTREIPVVAISANAMRADIGHGLAAGFNDYLIKPLDILQFLKTVDHYLPQQRENQP